jgi:hypothetical protein
MSLTDHPDILRCLHVGAYVWRLVSGGVLTTVEKCGRRLVTRTSLESIAREGAPNVE